MTDNLIDSAEDNSLTWEELDALMDAARDRESIRRIRHTWDNEEQYRKTDAIERALKKLKREFHRRHHSTLEDPK